MNTPIDLVKLNLSHSKELFILTLSNHTYLKEWLPWIDNINNLKDTENYIQSTLKASSIKRASNYAIFFENKICGIAGFHHIDNEHRIGSLGYWLTQEHMGKGIMTMAIQDLLKIGFNKFNLNKIEIRCAEKNYKSRAVPERLHFKYEASLRQCEWLHTKYVDHAIYSLLASEYRIP